MLKLIKNNVMVAVISSAIGSIITIVIIHHWYSKNISDVITSWITAISSLAVVVFAWMAYRYATKDYIRQKRIDHSIETAKKIISTLYFYEASIKTAETNMNTIFTEISSSLTACKFYQTPLINHLKKYFDIVNL